MRKLMIALALIGLASPAFAADCKYFEQASSPGATPSGNYLVLPGFPFTFSSATLHHANGTQEQCKGFWGDLGGTIECKSFPGGPAHFEMIGATLASSDQMDILVLNGVDAWYREACPR